MITKGTPVKAHRYKSIAAVPADGPWRGGEFLFLEGEYYGATASLIDPARCVKIAGVFTARKDGQKVYKTLLIHKEICKNNLVHDPIK